MINYAVRPKTGTLIDWAKYPGASLGISLGNSNEQGQKLRSIVAWLNRTFDYVTIDLSDTLYRWNLCGPDGAMQPNAAQLARQRGDQWLYENQDALSDFQIPFEIVRWDSLLQHQDFDAYLGRFQVLYLNDVAFRAAVESDVDNFIKRRRKAGHVVSALQADHCRAFVLEETAAHTILSRDRPNAAHVYPGDPLNAEEALRRDKIADAPQGMQGIPFVALRVERANTGMVQRPAQDKPLKSLVA